MNRSLTSRRWLAMGCVLLHSLDGLFVGFGFVGGLGFDVGGLSFRADAEAGEMDCFIGAELPHCHRGLVCAFGVLWLWLHRGVGLLPVSLDSSRWLVAVKTSIPPLRKILLALACWSWVFLTVHLLVFLLALVVIGL